MRKLSISTHDEAKKLSKIHIINIKLHIFKLYILIMLYIRSLDISLCRYFPWLALILAHSNIQFPFPQFCVQCRLCKLRLFRGELEMFTFWIFLISPFVCRLLWMQKTQELRMNLLSLSRWCSILDLVCQGDAVC